MTLQYRNGSTGSFLLQPKGVRQAEGQKQISSGCGDLLAVFDEDRVIPYQFL